MYRISFRGVEVGGLGGCLAHISVRTARPRRARVPCSQHQILQIPVSLLRWTHDNIEQYLNFRHDEHQKIERYSGSSLSVGIDSNDITRSTEGGGKGED